MDEKKPDLMSPEMAKLMVQQILNKHKVSKDKIAEISEDEKERFKELALTYKAHVENLLNKQSNDSQKVSPESTNESETKSELKSQKKMTLREKLRKRRGK